jgi:hypothetical protein
MGIELAVQSQRSCIIASIRRVAPAADCWHFLTGQLGQTSAKIAGTSPVKPAGLSLTNHHGFHTTCPGNQRGLSAERSTQGG